MNSVSVPEAAGALAPAPVAPRIQIVEDERIVALDLKETIESFGFDVIGTTARGVDAIAMAALHRPDLILMDINLEGDMDGTEAALRIRQDHRIPVIFLTAYAGDADLAMARAGAPYGYLIKPFETRELRATLTMALARHEAERATERSEERLRLALQAAAMVAWEWDPGSDGNWVCGALAAHGSAPLDILALGPDALLAAVHEDDRADIAAAVRAGEAIDARVRIRLRSNDAYRWVQLHAKTFAAAPGRQSRLLGVAQDVTDRLVLEEKLRSSEAAMASTIDGILILDGARRILSVNNAFCRLSGYSVDEVIGRNPDDFLHARRHADQAVAAAVSGSGGFWRGEMACRRKSGEIFPALQTDSAVSNDNGAVTNYVLTVTDITDLRRREARISHLALHDALTGLGNRRLLEQHLQFELANSRRLGRQLAFFFLDLDGFKVINDSVGHDAGDAMLKVIAGRIERNIRFNDLAIRIGGDEFLVIVPTTSEAECARMADKLLQMLAQPVSVQGEYVRVTGSIGIALHPQHGSEGSQLIKAADSAMYEAKRAGRNRFAFYTTELAQRARTRLVVEQGLRRAIVQRELFLHYQPIVHLADFRVLCFEALARWHHPEVGPIPPAQFIPVAEECGLIDDLGDAMLRHACTEWKDHVVGAPTNLRVAVNVSVRQFQGPDLVGRVQRILEETGFPPEALELEITESALQENDNGRQLLERLKRMGIAIAIDDFGTGYSSLSLLNRLPIDTIKIDRSFVSMLPADPAAGAITRAVLAMARSLHLEVVAEGIETVAQLHELQLLGCARGQGYVFSPAVAAPAAIDQSLARWLPPAK